MNTRKAQSAGRLALQLVLLLLLLIGLGALVGSEGFAWSQVQSDAGLIADIRDDFHNVLSDMGENLINLLDSFALASEPLAGSLKGSWM